MNPDYACLCGFPCEQYRLFHGYFCFARNVFASWAEEDKRRHEAIGRNAFRPIWPFRVTR